MSAMKELTNNILKPILADAMVFRGVATVPLEEITQTGIYQIATYTPSSELYPLGPQKPLFPYIGILIVLERGTVDIVHIIIGTEDPPRLLMRVCRLGTWQDAYEIALTKFV